VATNDVRFLEAGEFEAHEARCASARARCSPIRRACRRYTAQQFLRTPEQMQALFPEGPELLANSVEIARRCSLVLRLGETRLPVFPVPEGQTPEQFPARGGAGGARRAP